MPETQEGRTRSMKSYRSASAGDSRAGRATTSGIEFKGTSFKMMVLKVNDPRSESLVREVSATIAQSPNLFRHAPIVVDWPEEGPERELEEFVVALRKLDLVPVGLKTRSPVLTDRARSMNLAVFLGGAIAERRGSAGVRDIEPPAEPNVDETPKPQEKTSAATAPDEAPRVESKAEVAPATADAQAAAQATPTVAAPDTTRRTTMVIHEPVRSGQRVYAARADLIVLAPVGAGAEVLADGNIHIYDTLRGRALAGLSGDTSARIFCRRLEAELISIAGLYRVSENIDPACWKASVQIYLDADRLCVTRMN